VLRFTAGQLCMLGGIFSSVAVFTLFIVVLLAAPQGLFGSATARRV
jgi:branched-chain amino acid transport system permease protein